MDSSTRVRLGQNQGKGSYMRHQKISTTDSTPGENETAKLIREDVDDSKQSIEEAAYYIGMNRERYSHPGDHLNDWFEAEKAIQENVD